MSLFILLITAIALVLNARDVMPTLRRVPWFFYHLPGQLGDVQAAWAASSLLGRDPIFTWSIALTANQRDSRPLANWQYRRLPFRAHVRVCQRATTLGVQTTIYSGAETIQQRCPEQGGGTAGVTPVHFTTPVKEWVGASGDEIIVSNDEVLAGTPTVDGIVYVDPV